jgi:hypothetical protein
MNDTAHATCARLVFRQFGGESMGPVERDRNAGELPVPKDHVPAL